MEQFHCIYNNYKCTYPLTKQFHFWKFITQILHTNEMMNVYDYCWSITRGPVRSWNIYTKENSAAVPITQNDG